jgi:hypothetical protein
MSIQCIYHQLGRRPFYFQSLSTSTGDLDMVSPQIRQEKAELRLKTLVHHLIDLRSFIATQLKTSIKGNFHVLLKRMKKPRPASETFNVSLDSSRSTRQPQDLREFLRKKMFAQPVLPSFLTYYLQYHGLPTPRGFTAMPSSSRLAHQEFHGGMQSSRRHLH